MIKSRLQKLEGKQKPDQPVIVLMPGEEPDQDQRQQMARAEKAGIKSTVIRIVPASKERAQHGS